MGRAAPFLNNARRDRVGEAQKEKKGRERKMEVKRPRHATTYTHSRGLAGAYTHRRRGREKELLSVRTAEDGGLLVPTDFHSPTAHHQPLVVGGWLLPPTQKPTLSLLLLAAAVASRPILLAKIFFFFYYNDDFFFLPREESVIPLWNKKKLFFFCCLTVIKKRMVHHYYLLINE